MIRFAILSAVSTDEQARADKQSMPDQIEITRHALRDGVETSGPYVLDGYSRTGYENLSDALRDIPPLAQMVVDAEANKFDVLGMDNFDRLGDLAPMLRTRFKKLKKQLYSARQSGTIIPPDQYDPYTDDVTDISMHVEGIIQSYRINKLRRGWNIGVPDRVRRGLQPLNLTYGYKWRGKDTPPKIESEKCDLIIRMKDWFLEGKSLIEICKLADETGIKPRKGERWNGVSAKRILANPFYAGKVIFGRYSGHVPQPPSKWIVGVGQHERLWDEPTYFAIQNEIDRRKTIKPHGARYSISGLLVCSECKQKLARHGRLNSKYPASLFCRTGNSHVIIDYDLAVKFISKKIANELQNAEFSNPSPNEDLIASIAEQKELRNRVQVGYEEGLYTDIEAAKRLTDIELYIEKLEARLEKEAKLGAREEVKEALSGGIMDDFENWMRNYDPNTVNRLLTSLCERVIISPTYDIQIIWR